MRSSLVSATAVGVTVVATARSLRISLLTLVLREYVLVGGVVRGLLAVVAPQRLAGHGRDLGDLDPIRRTTLFLLDELRTDVRGL